MYLLEPMVRLSFTQSSEAADFLAIGLQMLISSQELLNCMERLASSSWRKLIFIYVGLFINFIFNFCAIAFVLCPMFFLPSSKWTYHRRSTSNLFNCACLSYPYTNSFGYYCRIKKQWHILLKFLGWDPYYQKCCWPWCLMSWLLWNTYCPLASPEWWQMIWSFISK